MHRADRWKCAIARLERNDGDIARGFVEHGHVHFGGVAP